MGSFKEYGVRVADILRATDGRPSEFAGSGPNTKVVTNDVTVLATAQTTSTFTMTPTRVDTATAGSATGAITADATDATMAANIQTAIRALGGIYADATCTAGTADTFIITVFGGYDVTWATTATSPTITESGAAGGTTAVPGKVTYTGLIPVKGYAVAKRIRIKGFADNSLDVTVTDAGSRTIFSATGIDTWTSPNDVQYLKLLTADGVAGEDGAAAANVSGGVFDGPFSVTIATSAPIGNAATDFVGTAGGLRTGAGVFLVCKTDRATAGKNFLKRSTGAMATGVASTTVNLGEEFVNVKRIKLLASADTSIAPTLTDADGLVVYTKTATDYTTAVVAQLSHEGVDQANNAVADLLDVIAHSPITVAVSGGVTSGTFTVETIVEV